MDLFENALSSTGNGRHEEKTDTSRILIRCKRYTEGAQTSWPCCLLFQQLRWEDLIRDQVPGSPLHFTVKNHCSRETYRLYIMSNFGNYTKTPWITILPWGWIFIFCSYFLSLSSLLPPETGEKPVWQIFSAPPVPFP